MCAVVAGAYLKCTQKFEHLFTLETALLSRQQVETGSPNEPLPKTGYYYL